jgi:replication factor C large subunit
MIKTLKLDCGIILYPNGQKADYIDEEGYIIDKVCLLLVTLKLLDYENIRPRKVDDVVNQDEAKKVLIPWIEEWASGRVPSKRTVLLWGPPGVGKTSLVEALARTYDFEVVELNASDFRRKQDVERIVGAAATRRSLFKKGYIILLDEVDGIAGREDYGGVEAINRIIDYTRNPIVMTANDPWKDKLRPLRDKVLMVQFRPLKNLITLIVYPIHGGI